MYNTKGIGHRTYRAQYDSMYNSGWVWPEIIDSVIADALTCSRGLILGRHVSERIDNDYYGNRQFTREEINVNAIMSGEPVEAEFSFEDYGEDDYFNCLRKAIIRLPEREDGEQVCVVVRFKRNGTLFIRTAWLNNSNDNHNTLDTEDFDWEKEGQLFGYVSKDKAYVWKIKDDKATELPPGDATHIMEDEGRK